MDTRAIGGGTLVVGGLVFLREAVFWAVGRMLDGVIQWVSSPANISGVPWGSAIGVVLVIAGTIVLLWPRVRRFRFGGGFDDSEINSRLAELGVAVGQIGGQVSRLETLVVTLPRIELLAKGLLAQRHHAVVERANALAVELEQLLDRMATMPPITFGPKKRRLIQAISVELWGLGYTQLEIQAAFGARGDEIRTSNEYVTIGPNEAEKWKTPADKRNWHLERAELSALRALIEARRTMVPTDADILGAIRLGESYAGQWQHRETI